MSRSAIYIRVSTQKQADKYSIPAQIRILTDHCKSLNADYLLYNEGGVSGETIEDRPQIQKLLQDARKGLFDTCLVIELERLSRSDDLLDWLTIKKVFKQNNIAIATPNQRFDLKDEEDDFLSDLFGALSKREKRKILKRMERGRLEASRKGNCIVGGKSRFGYDYNPLTKRLEINPAEAETVKRIFALYQCQDSSTKKIAATLNQEHASSKYGAKWDNARIRRILRDLTYAGEWHYNKRTGKAKGKLKPQNEWIKVAVPAIIEKETFEQVQKMIESRKNIRHPSGDVKYLLKDLLYCGDCGEKFNTVTRTERYLNANTRNQDMIHFQYYRCSGEIKNKPCGMPRLQAASVESVIWNKVKQLIKKPSLIREAAEREMKARVKSDQAGISKPEELRQALEKNKEQETRIFDAYKQEIISVQQLDRELGKIRDERDRLEKAVQNEGDGPGAREKILEACKGLEERLRAIRMTGREEYLVLRSLLTGLLAGVFVTNRGKCGWK